MAKKDVQKVAAAKRMYVEMQMQSKEIAGLLNVSVSTINRWAAGDGWDLEKSAFFGQAKELVKQNYAQIQLIHDTAKQEERALTSSEVDAITKLSSSIRNLEKGLSLSDYISVMQEFAEFLRQNVSLEVCQSFIKYQQAFISNKLKHLL